nr:ABC-2 transporter permease [uncultured Faecalimonas sp.]
MSGLLIKDLKLMKEQRSFVFLIIAVGIGITVFTGQSDFVLGYMTFIGAMFSMSSISYDEFDNGNLFLFSLPITRKGYVIEKYIFALLTSIVSWVLAVGISAGAKIWKGQPIETEWIFVSVFTWVILVFLMMCMLPVHLKFGGEKMKIAFIGIVGVAFLIGLAAVKISEKMGLDLAVVVNQVEQMQIGRLLLAAMIVTAVVSFVSLWISVRIVERKEF